MRRLIFYSILFFLGLVVQFSWSRYMAISGLAPNFIVVFLIFFSLLRGPMPGQLLGFAWGLSWDIMSVDLFGSHALIFTFIGYFMGKLSKKWDENIIATQMLLTFLASVFYWLALFLLYQIFIPGEIDFKFNYIIILQPIYNMIIAPLIFKVCKFLISSFDEYFVRY